MAPKNVAWVTGASGFIGTHVARRFRAEGWTVVGIDRRQPAAPDPLTLSAEVDDHSLGAAYDMAGPPRAVFHGAGTGTVSQSQTDPRASQRDTVGSTRALLGFLNHDAPRCRVVLASSAAVYGAADDAPLAEDRALAPISAYGEHKQAAEELCRKAAVGGQLVTILRMFSVYGPGQRKQLPWDLGRKLLQQGTDAIELAGTGQETRDFLAVDDASRLIVGLATASETPLVLNGGTGIATTIADFAALLAKALGVTREIRFNGQTRPGDPRHYLADVGRLKSLGFSPDVTLADGITAYATWLKAARR